MKQPVAEFWFAIDAADNDILQLREIWIDPYLAGNIWLLRGSPRSLVIDTGTGMVSPLPILRSIAHGPLVAVSCNGWYDHAGGLHYFQERACHKLDRECIEHPTDASSAAITYVNADMLAALPHADFAMTSYRMQGKAPTRLLEHGEIIDLGNRQLEVIHCPGITPGSIALWEKSTGSLFTSDLLYDDPLEAERVGEESPPTYNQHDHVQSLLKLRELPVVTVYPGHFASFGRQRMLELIDAYLVGA